MGNARARKAIPQATLGEGWGRGGETLGSQITSLANAQPRGSRKGRDSHAHLPHRRERWAFLFAIFNPALVSGGQDGVGAPTQIARTGLLSDGHR